MNKFNYEYEGKKEEYEVCPECEYILNELTSLKEDIAKLNYNTVHIEIDTYDSLKKLYESIKEEGDAKIKISIKENNKNYIFELKNKRKFNFEKLEVLNKERYIKKISV